MARQARIELTQEECFDIAGTLNTEAQRFESLIATARAERSDWVGSITVWEDKALSLRTLSAKIMLSLRAKAA